MVQAVFGDFEVRDALPDQFEVCDGGTEAGVGSQHLLLVELVAELVFEEDVEVAVELGLGHLEVLFA